MQGVHLSIALLGDMLAYLLKCARHFVRLVLFDELTDNYS